MKSAGQGPVGLLLSNSTAHGRVASISLFKRLYVVCTV